MEPKPGNNFVVENLLERTRLSDVSHQWWLSPCLVLHLLKVTQVQYQQFLIYHQTSRHLLIEVVLCSSSLYFVPRISTSLFKLILTHTVRTLEPPDWLLYFEELRASRWREGFWSSERTTEVVFQNLLSSKFEFFTFLFPFFLFFSCGAFSVFLLWAVIDSLVICSPKSAWKVWRRKVWMCNHRSHPKEIKANTLS